VCLCVTTPKSMLARYSSFFRFTQHLYLSLFLVFFLNSGGSSGAIMAFFTEAIFANPYVTKCGGGGDDHCCSLDEQNGRISFLLRSFEELANGFRSTLQDNSLGNAAGFLQQVEAAGIVTDLNGTSEEQQTRGVANLIALMVRWLEGKKQGHKTTVPPANKPECFSHVFFVFPPSIPSSVCPIINRGQHRTTTQIPPGNDGGQ
jgi:hypothetical protein